MTERIELPDRTLYFADFYDADAWINTHLDAYPTAATEEWNGTSPHCLYDAATGALHIRGDRCPGCTSAPCPDVAWSRTALYTDFKDALRARGITALPSLVALASDLAALSPEISGAEIADAVLVAPHVLFAGVRRHLRGPLRRQHSSRGRRRSTSTSSTGGAACS